MAANETSFQPGNTAALVHGARSARMIRLNRAEVATEIRAVLVDIEAGLTPQQRPLFDAWIDVLTQLSLCNRHINQTGLLSRKGAPKPVADLWLRLHRLAMAQWAALGLGKEVSPVNLDAELAQRRMRKFEEAANGHG